jgi:hypothetical protein
MGDDELPHLDEGDAVRDGIWRRGFEHCVTFQPDYLYYDHTVASWDYAVEKYPFVPGFHVVRLFDDDHDTEIVLSTHKTLAEAMSICKVLLANGGVHYV